MKIISDIRIFKSTEGVTHMGITEKSLNLAVHRIAMKLREYGFSLGDFDHLYINFTTQKPQHEITLVQEADKYHPWYRYCDVGVCQNEYDKLSSAECVDYIYERIQAVLLALFNEDNSNGEIIRNALREAAKGPEMLMRFKEKKSAKATAIVFLRLLDSGKYAPLLCVLDLNGNEILRKNLPETIDLSTIGEIQLSSKKVTIKPRKNAFSKGLAPVSFELKSAAD